MINIFIQLNNKLAGQPEWVQDANGKITGYKTDVGGADTVFPFSSDIIVHPFHVWTESYYTFERDAENVYVFARNNSGAPKNLNGESITFKESNIVAGEPASGGTGSYMHHFGPVKKGDVVCGRYATWIVY